jgi:transposase
METQATTSEARIAQLEAALAVEKALTAELERERDALTKSHERLRLELELLRKRMFVAKAERVDTTQLALEFAAKLKAVEEAAGTMDMLAAKRGEEVPSGGGESKLSKRKPSGRRKLSDIPLDERRVEITDPLFEKLVDEGKATRIGHEESYKLAWQRGGFRRLVIAKTKYRTVAVDENGDAELETAQAPKELISRCLAATSLLAYLLIAKYFEGLPLFRLEQRLARDGVPIDRGTICRWMEHLGATFGATVIEAMRREALRTAFCISTDATGIAVQPARSEDRTERHPCRRGHYFVQIADRDAVFFEYTPQENSTSVAQMFAGFSGYVQADAKNVFDVLFELPEEDDTDTVDIRHEVACWSHARRKFWEATVAKSAVAREGLARISRIFELDGMWASLAPEARKRMRDNHLRPHVDAFFAWAEMEFEKVRQQRGLLRSAFGYALRQHEALCRFFDDGRLALDNNRSERALRAVAVGRKSWLFVGSDDHAVATGHLFTLVATARLHRLDPEAYIRDLIRVLPHWPNDRYIELAPKYWLATRARLVASEIEAELGALTIPAPIPPSEQQVATG